MWTGFVCAVLGDTLFLPDCDRMDISGEHTISGFSFSPNQKWLDLARDNLSNYGEILRGLAHSLMSSGLVGAAGGGSSSSSALQGLRKQMMDTVWQLSGNTTVALPNLRR